MSKLEITEIQIDSYNDTYNQNQKFDCGLNIICGENEAGKSTLMNFIKKIFIKKSEAKGYIKCRLDNEEFNLRAEKNKRKANEQFLEKINPHEFQTGFIINLDDVMLVKNSDEEDLLDTIKDLSGRAVNIKEKEYKDKIYDAKKQRFSLTSSNNASTNFSKQFNKLKSMNDNIKKAEAKEEEYNSLCLELDILQKDINNLNEKIEIGNIVVKKNELKNKLNNLKINKKLIEKKSDFDNLREDFGALNFLKQNENNLKNELEEKEKELKKYNNFENLDDYNFTSEDLKYSNSLLEKERELNKLLETLNKEIEQKKEKIYELEFEQKKYDNELKYIGIEDADKYKDDKALLESYKDNYSDLQNKALSNVNKEESLWYNKMFLLLFSAMFFVCLGFILTYWNTNFRFPLIIFILISIAGINTTIMGFISHKRNKNNNGFSKTLEINSNQIKKICEKYQFEIEKGDNFIVKLGAFIQQMNHKLSEYKIVENNLLKVRIDIEKEKTGLNIKEKDKEKLEKNIKDSEKEKKEFLDKNKTDNLADFSDFYFNINRLKSVKKEALQLMKEIENIDKNTDNFIKNYNKFIENTDLIQFSKLNKYDFPQAEKLLSEIREIIDENISQNKLCSELNDQINNFENEFNKFSQELRENSEKIEDLNELTIELQAKRDEKAALLQKKKDLEVVSDLLNMKNNKLIELNNIKLGLINLMKKEMVYNIIKKAKEKFNSIQPNLLSAKKYFNLITDGKYSEIDFENFVISSDKIGEKSWTELSRGTKEQLYLALRLGYACNYTKDINNNPNGMYNLPFIIDDAFVNFDQKRTKCILKCLSEFSKTNQVIFFTCHSESIKRLLKEENIKYNLIEL